MENLKRFTAEQAREFKRSCVERTIYERVMSGIYTNIKQSCRIRSFCSTNLSGYNATLTEKVIQTLLDDGYIVDFDYMSGIVTVKW